MSRVRDRAAYREDPAVPPEDLRRTAIAGIQLSKALIPLVAGAPGDDRDFYLHQLRTVLVSHLREGLNLPPDQASEGRRSACSPGRTGRPREAHRWVTPATPSPDHDVGMTRERRINLGRRTHKGVLLVHIMSSGAWIGIDVVMAVLVFTAWSTDDVQKAVICYQALELFAVWPLITAGLLSLLTGILLGLGTKYGLVKYWWVVVKLTLNLLLTTLVVISLRFGVADLAEYGRQLAAGTPAFERSSDMLYPPIVSPTALTIAFILSIYKPWGRIRKHRPA